MSDDAVVGQYLYEIVQLKYKRILGVFRNIGIRDAIPVSHIIVETKMMHRLDVSGGFPITYFLFIEFVPCDEFKSNVYIRLEWDGIDPLASRISTFSLESPFTLSLKESHKITQAINTYIKMDGL